MYLPIQSCVTFSIQVTIHVNALVLREMMIFYNYNSGSD